MNVAVIGGGPAGMMAAIVAAQNGANVTLFEKNEKLGKKMYISGKGRCNLTNNCEVKEFFQNVPTNPKFLMSCINKFSPENVMDFCQSRGLRLKTERGNRVFPLSDKSSDVIKCFERALRDYGVAIRLNSEILSVEYQNDTFLLTTITDIERFDRVIIATGGISYRATGCTGDGYKFAKSFSHKVIDTKPALCKLLCKGAKPLEGLSLKNVEVNVVKNGKVIDNEFGEMLFAADGITGPLVLTLSSRVNKLNMQGAILSVDLKPALNEETLDARILRDFSARMNKDFINSLDALLPERLIEAVAKQSGIPFNQKVNKITAEQRARLVNAIKNLQFSYVGLDDINFAIVTSGGVDVKAINPSTMESKLQKGLFFAGEVIDVDAYTGGFNIQIALSTGYAAGTAASKE